MGSLNKAMLIGHVGKDPEMRYMPDGKAVANISVATSETWKDKAGEKQEKTEWHRVSFFGRLAEVVGEYVKKGSSLYVEGRIQTRKWQDKDGADRYTTEIIADRLQLLGDRKPSGDKGKGYAEAKGGKPSQQERGPGGLASMDDDTPF